MQEKMKQKEDVENMEMFQTKPIRKAFKPSLADIVKQINEKFKDENSVNNSDLENRPLDSVIYVETGDRANVVAQLKNFKTINEKINFLIKADPRDNSNFMKGQYVEWARDNSKTRTDLASMGSKVCFWLGCTFLGTPESKGMPDYIYYLPWDRYVCFSGHFKNYGNLTLSERENFILTTNMWIILTGNQLAKRAATLLLAFTFALIFSSATIKKISNKYDEYQNNSKIEAMQKQTEEQQIADLKTDALALVAKYKAGEVTPEQFETQKQLLKEREAQIKTTK